MATPKKPRRVHVPIPFEDAVRRIMSAPPAPKKAKAKAKPAQIDWPKPKKK